MQSDSESPGNLFFFWGSLPSNNQGCRANILMIYSTSFFTFPGSPSSDLWLKTAGLCSFPDNSSEVTDFHFCLVSQSGRRLSSFTLFFRGTEVEACKDSREEQLSDRKLFAGQGSASFLPVAKKETSQCHTLSRLDCR